MVRTRSHLRDLALGTGLEFPVFEDGKVDFADAQPREIDGDALFDRARVGRIGQVPRLAAVDHANVLGGVEVAARIAGGRIGDDASLAPHVALADIVIVRDGHDRAVFDDLAEVVAPQQPSRGVLGMVVTLVAGEEQQVGVLFLQLGNDRVAVAAVAVRVAGQRTDDDRVFVHGIPADQPFKYGIATVPDPVRDALGRVPGSDAEMGRPAGVDHRGAGHFAPLAVGHQFQSNFSRLVRLQRVQLGGHLQHAAVVGVQREPDDLIARHADELGQEPFGRPRPDVFTRRQIQGLAARAGERRFRGAGGESGRETKDQHKSASPCPGFVRHDVRLRFE